MAIKFKVEALRTLTSPYKRGKEDESSSETIYYLLVDMKELPTGISLDVNPRKPKMTTNVAKSLLNAVVEPTTDFYINNRGIVISAKSLSFNSKYSVSSGYIYPIFGAFRSLLRFEQDTLSWIFEPLELWNEVGVSIVQNTFETSTNPQLAGKDKQLWLANYRIVETQSLRKQLERR